MLVLWWIHTQKHAVLFCLPVGFAKNKAVTQSSGQYLCFQDAVGVLQIGVL